jgi:hypothetical protein
MRFLPPNEISASNNTLLMNGATGTTGGHFAPVTDSTHPMLQWFYADGSFNVGQISPIYVIQGGVKKYLSNPIEGSDKKGVYVEYCLETTPGCRSLAFKPSKTGNWLSYAFPERDFLYLLVPRACRSSESKFISSEKGRDVSLTKDKNTIALPSVPGKKFSFPLTKEILSQLSMQNDEKGFDDSSSCSSSSSSSSGVNVLSYSDSVEIVERDSNQKFSSSSTQRRCSSSRSSSRSSSSDEECCEQYSPAKDCEERCPRLDFGLWTNISSQGKPVVPTGGGGGGSTGNTSPLVPLTPATNPVNPVVTPAVTIQPATTTTTNLSWVGWVFAGVGLLILLLLLIWLGYSAYRSYTAPVVVAKRAPVAPTGITTTTNVVNPAGQASQVTTTVKPVVAPPAPPTCTKMVVNGEQIETCSRPLNPAASVAPPLPRSLVAPPLPPCPPNMRQVTYTQFPDGSRQYVN